MGSPSTLLLWHGWLPQQSTLTRQVEAASDSHQPVQPRIQWSWWVRSHLAGPRPGQQGRAYFECSSGHGLGSSTVCRSVGGGWSGHSEAVGVHRTLTVFLRVPPFMFYFCYNPCEKKGDDFHCTGGHEGLVKAVEHFAFIPALQTPGTQTTVSASMCHLHRPQVIPLPFIPLSSLCLFLLILLGHIYSLRISLSPSFSEVSLCCVKRCHATDKPAKMSILGFESRRLISFNYTKVIESWILDTTKTGRYAMSFTLDGSLLNRWTQLKAGRRELLCTAGETCSFTGPAMVNIGANTQEQVNTRAFPEVLSFGRAYLQLSSDVHLDVLSV